MLVHGRPFTEMLVSGLPDDPAAHTKPSFIRVRGDGPGSVAEVPSCKSAALDHAAAPISGRFVPG